MHEIGGMKMVSSSSLVRVRDVTWSLECALCLTRVVSFREEGRGAVVVVVVFLC